MKNYATHSGLGVFSITLTMGYEQFVSAKIVQYFTFALKYDLIGILTTIVNIWYVVRKR